jgi:hypothetical protein
VPPTSLRGRFHPGSQISILVITHKFHATGQYRRRPLLPMAEHLYAAIPWEMPQLVEFGGLKGQLHDSPGQRPGKAFPIRFLALKARDKAPRWGCRDSLCRPCRAWIPWRILNPRRCLGLSCIGPSGRKNAQIQGYPWGSMHRIICGYKQEWKFGSEGESGLVRNRRSNRRGGREER